VDYSPFPFEPIVEGVVTFDALGNPVFNGRGVSNVSRVIAVPAGAFVLQLDAGLPGNAGAVPPGVAPFSNPNVRTVISTRGAGIPPIPNIVTKAVNYLLSPVPGVGADRILVVTQTFPLALADPAGGFEIITWRTMS
jgi:hypothetical protein